MIITSKNLTLFSGLLVLVGTLLLLTFQKLTPLIGHVTYYCQSLLLSANMIPIPYFLSITPFVILLLVFSLSIIKFVILNTKIMFLKHKLKKNITNNYKLKLVITKLGLGDKVLLAKSDTPFAFCLGVRNPKIYISTGMLSKLTSKELEVVLLHEQYHLENHDSMTSIVAYIANSLFPFFPLIHDLIKKYKIEREIKADNFAVTQIGDRYPLVLALKKLLAFPTEQTLSLASIADQDTLEPRIYTLINKPYIRRQFRLRHLFVTLFSSLVLATIIILPVDARELHHEQHDVMMLCTDGKCTNSCTSEKNLNKLYSEIPLTNSVKERAATLYTPAH